MRSHPNASAALNLPAWLAKAQLTQYRREASFFLGEREMRRTLARDLSRPRGHDPEVYHSENYATVTQEMVNHYAVFVGSNPEHQRKNRYYQLEAYDRTRVTVGDAEDMGRCDRYLNASWVQERYGRRWWIANQAPLPHTAHAFLSIVMQPTAFPPESLHNADQAQLTPCRIRTIVQLTQNIEGGRTKAHPYFPDQVGQSLILTPEVNFTAKAIKSRLLEVRHHEDALCIESIVSVVPVAWYKESPTDSSNGEGQVIQHGEEGADPILFRHMLYYAWPDHGVPSPEDRLSLLSFIRLVHALNKVPVCANEVKPNDSLDPPMMVGCSAGVGRTGTFIALSSLLRTYDLLPDDTTPSSHPNANALSSLFRRQSGSRRHPIPNAPSQSPLGPIPEPFADDLVVQEIDSLREQRPFMVQQDQQACLVYDVLAAELSAKQSGAGSR